MRAFTKFLLPMLPLVVHREVPQGSSEVASIIRSLSAGHCYVLRVSVLGAPSAGFVDCIRTFHHGAFPLDALVRAKQKQGTSVSVCIPAHNEESTVGTVVSSVVQELVVKHSLVDEVIVLDDRCSDRTAAVAAAAGARIVAVAEIVPEISCPPGKGNAMWRSLHASDGDIVCWIDADIRGFRVEMISGTVGPLLELPGIGFVKGFYARPTNEDDRGGGRVTELVAKPLIKSLFPQLVGVHQPLAGATAARRDVLESLSFPSGWGVELALLLDVARKFGVETIAQTDLGELRHRNKPLEKLIPQATAVIDVALARSGIAGAALAPLFASESLCNSAQRMVELPPANELGLEKAGRAQKKSA